MKVTIKEWQNIPAGGTVWSGFNYDLTAPSTEGNYTLYEVVGEDNTHRGWEWVRE